MKVNRTSQISAILISVLVVSAVLVAGAFAADRPFEGQTLIVGTWSGPYAKNFEEAFSKPFEEMTGAKLLHKYSWDFTPEIIAAPENDPPLDVTITADSDYLLGVKRKLWLPIRYENVPNADKIFDIIKDEMSPTTEYGVPFDVGIHVLMYRKDLVKTPPASWKDLFADEYKGKIAIERWFPYWVYIGSYLTDYDPPKKAIYSPEGREAIFDQMKNLSDRWFFCYSKGAEFWAAMDSGEITVGNYWNGTGTVKVLEDPDRFAMVLPEEGAVAYLDHFCVVRGTKKRDLAEAFINYLVSTKGQTAFLKKHYNLMVNKEVVPEIPAVMGDIHPKKDEDWRKISFIDAEALEPLRKELEDRFIKEVLAK
ncbi:MAG: extracellular solute-binding protein [Desulfobacterales bacterium]|nr:extracellular solute-binding protein [Desulfobacterales bacterium]